MHRRIPCRQQSVAKTQSEAESKRAVKPRASRLAGSARGRASRIGEAESKATNKISWANKALTERGQSIRPKQDKSGQFAKKRACSKFSTRRNHVRATNCPRGISRTAIAPSAVVAQSPAIECQYSRHNNTRAGGWGTTP